MYNEEMTDYNDCLIICNVFTIMQEDNTKKERKLSLKSEHPALQN